MRECIVVVMMIVCMPIGVIAAPYLGCAIPPAEDQILGVRGEIDGISFETLYTIRQDRLGVDYLVIYDIGNLDAQRHTFTNIRFFNIRSEGGTVPFDLPRIPGSPSNIGLMP